MTYPNGFSAGNLQAIYIEMYFQADIKCTPPRKLGHGTGFLFKCNQAGSRGKPLLNLGTAAHNFSGRDFFTNDCLDEKKSLPSFVRIYLPLRASLDWHAYDLDLDTTPGSPNWQIMKSGSFDTDVASIQFELPTESRANDYYLCPWEVSGISPFDASAHLGIGARSR